MRNAFILERTPWTRLGRVSAALLLAAPLVLSSVACDLGLPAGRAPHVEGNRLDMIDQPKLKPQRALWTPVITAAGVKAAGHGHRQRPRPRRGAGPV